MQLNIANRIGFLLAGTLVLCCGCGEQPYTITFENQSGVEISEIHATPDSRKAEAKNLLSENLPDGESVTLTVGKFKEDYIEEGFHVAAYNAVDGSYQTFDLLMVKNGGRVTFYMDNIELCAAVDATAEEIEALKNNQE